jgi:hypothetical protein
MNNAAIAKHDHELTTAAPDRDVHLYWTGRPDLTFDNLVDDMLDATDAKCAELMDAADLVSEMLGLAEACEKLAKVQSLSQQHDAQKLVNAKAAAIGRMGRKLEARVVEALLESYW